MPRRILLLITDLQIGGTPTVVRELAMRLNRLGAAQVEVACLAPWGPVADELKAAGVAVYPLAAQSVRDLAVIGRLIALVRRRGYDTVFSFLVHANTAAAIAAQFVRFHLIESIQTTQPRPRWHWWVQRLVRCAADAVVVPSPSARDAAEAWSGVPPERIIIIPNAVDVGSFPPSPVPQEDPRPYPIGFIGRLDPVKRIPHLVRSLLSVRALVHLHVYGEGPERPEILAAVESCGLRGTVTLHGSIARPQEALQRLGLLVLPSLAEGFGLVLIEAMAAGVPVVATDVAGVRDIVINEQTGLLVNRDDEHALAAAIDRVVGDPALRHRLIDQAKQEVRSRFTWERVLPMYLRLLGL